MERLSMKKRTAPKGLSALSDGGKEGENSDINRNSSMPLVMAEVMRQPCLSSYGKTVGTVRDNK